MSLTDRDEPSTVFASFMTPLSQYHISSVDAPRTPTPPMPSVVFHSNLSTKSLKSFLAVTRGLVLLPEATKASPSRFQPLALKSFHAPSALRLVQPSSLTRRLRNSIAAPSACKPRNPLLTLNSVASQAS